MVTDNEGLTRVIMAKGEYITKAMELLEDANVHKLMDETLIKTQDNQISRTANKLVKVGKRTKQNQWQVKFGEPVCHQYSVSQNYKKQISR